MILQFCRCGGLFDAKGNPDGFLSHYPSLRNFRPGGFFDSLRRQSRRRLRSECRCIFSLARRAFQRHSSVKYPSWVAGGGKKWLACRKACALVRIPEQVQQPVPLLRKLVRKAAQDALLFRRDMLQAQRGHRKCLIRQGPLGDQLRQYRRSHCIRLTLNA